MKLNLRNAIAFFDLEATGTNVGTDRIVEISIVKLHPDQGREIYTKRVNPGIPIPLEASLIHGIYDKDVKNEPFFKDIAKEIQQFIGTADLGGFNVLKYDIPLLVEEFLRSGIDFDLENFKPQSGFQNNCVLRSNTRKNIRLKPFIPREMLSFVLRNSSLK